VKKRSRTNQSGGGLGVCCLGLGGVVLGGVVGFGGFVWGGFYCLGGVFGFGFFGEVLRRDAANNANS